MLVLLRLVVISHAALRMLMYHGWSTTFSVIIHFRSFPDLYATPCTLYVSPSFRCIYMCVSLSCGLPQYMMLLSAVPLLLDYAVRIDTQKCKMS